MSTLNKIIVHLPSEFIRTPSFLYCKYGTYLSYYIRNDWIVKSSNYTNRTFLFQRRDKCFCQIYNKIWYKRGFWMITKWATSIANKLAELSGEDVSADQLEIYIYGLECFLNTFITIVLLFVWGVLSHTLGCTLIWVITFSLLLTLYRRCPCSNAVNMYLRHAFFSDCLDKWAITI